MRSRRRCAVLLPALLLGAGAGAQGAEAPSFGAPILKWQRGGCFGSYCQTGWYSSPAVADLNGDGQPDVIWGSYDVVSLNGASGALQWRGASGNRVWPGVAVADLTGDGTLEVIVGRNSDQVTVYDRFGAVVWTRNPFGSGEVRTLAVADLETDGQLEVVVGRASVGSNMQLSVYEPNGTVRPGWPSPHNGDPGTGWGMYNENVTVADMNGDGLKEILGPTDTHYITGLDRNGNQLPTNAIYNNINPQGPKIWRQVGVHVDNYVDLIGYANCGVQHRPNWANSAPVTADVNGDGVPEWIAVGNVYNCGTNPYTDLYYMPFILKLDRTRWSGSGFDWTAIPVPGPGSAPLSEDYNEIENAVPNPAVADLDGDGFKEILFPSYDGKVHAYWLDKTEHGSWPYVVPATGAPGDEFRFAGEPVVADLDNDGQAEVLFTSWPKKTAPIGTVGQVHVLSSLGVELFRVNLPPPFGDDWNGGLGAPTLANIDADPDLELVAGTSASGVVAYDLPNTANARILWGTGRGGYRRTGVADLPVTMATSDCTVTEGDVGQTSCTFTVSLSTASSQAVTVSYATANGTAVAGQDYVSASGTLTFPPFTTVRTVAVGVIGDLIDEPNETFLLNLSSPVNATITDGQGVGTILDNDPPPAVSIGDCAVLEGNAGSVPCNFTVVLTSPSSFTAGVSYATADVTATAGSDYTAAAGTLTFTPGTSSQPVAVSILGDTVVETDETFVVNLTGPTNATLGDAQGVGTIGDDDAVSLSSSELHHGSVQRADLLVRPDLYRIGQKPYSSYEVVIDGTSGDIVPVTLERLAGNNVTVAQSASPVAVGDTVSLRWENTTSLTVVNQHIRVNGVCATPCGIDDVYRIQAFETTYSIPRFNNAGSQVTVLLLQNPAGYPVTGTIWFWSTSGVLAGSRAFSLPARQTLVLNTATVAGVAGQGGTITISHDGRYGDLAGKTVALEPSTGFSFDSPMTARPR
jgi:Calx-beta domain-containing protein/VCBS repeat protein/FG-GAP repeat protein